MRVDPGFTVRFHDPSAARPRDLGERLLAALDMHETAKELIAARARLRNPDATAADIERAIVDWLCGGDPGYGRPRPWSG